MVLPKERLLSFRNHRDAQCWRSSAGHCAVGSGSRAELSHSTEAALAWAPRCSFSALLPVDLSLKCFGAFRIKLSAGRWGSVKLQSCHGGGGTSIEQTRSSSDLQSVTAALTSPSSFGPRWGTQMLRSTPCSGLGARRELCNFSPAFGLEGETAESEPRGAQH